MKNISRRVFIKGMAVAAVATAASTVLAGCNVIGTEETPVAGFVPESKTMTVGDNSVTFSTTSFAVTYDNMAKVGMTVVNARGEDLKIDSSVISAYLDGDKLNKPVTLEWSDNWSENIEGVTVPTNASSSTSVASYSKSGYAYFALPEKWTSLTVVCQTSLKDKDKKDIKKEVTFTINK